MKKGDFSSLAKDYANYRPGYNRDVINHIIFATGLNPDEIRAADVGAGTGIFASSLYECGIKNITAVEPNDEMRKVGKEANTKDFKFLKGSAEKTNLPFKSFNLVSMASSFHWTNYAKALKEFDNLLTENGIFTAIWNPRLTEKSEVESRVQSLLSNKYGVLKRVSSGRSGITENLKEVLLETGYFKSVLYLDAVDLVYRSHEDYLGAWRSVNDIQAELGGKKFNSFIADIENILVDYQEVEVHYLTRAWVAKKV